MASRTPSSTSTSTSTSTTGNPLAGYTAEQIAQLAAILAAQPQAPAEGLEGVDEDGSIEIRLSISTSDKKLGDNTICNVTGGRVVTGPTGPFLSFMPTAFAYTKEDRKLILTSEGYKTYKCWSRLIKLLEGKRSELDINLDKFLDKWLGAYPHKVINADVPSDMIPELRRIVASKLDASLVLRLDHRAKAYAGKEPEPLMQTDELGSKEPVFYDGKPILKKTFNVTLSHIDIIWEKTSSDEESEKMVNPMNFRLAVEEAIKESSQPRQYFPQWKLDREVAMCNEYIVKLRSKLDYGKSLTERPEKVLSKSGVRDDLLALASRIIASDPAAREEYDACVIGLRSDTSIDQVSVENLINTCEHRIAHATKPKVEATPVALPEPVVVVVVVPPEPSKEVTFDEVIDLDDLSVWEGIGL